MLKEIFFLKNKSIYFNHNECLRPTKFIVREQFFSWISFLLKRLYVIDFFAGSCIFGFLFFYLGVKKILNLEINKYNYIDILSNITRLNIDLGNIFFLLNIDSYLWMNKFNFLNFSLFIFDPPYSLSNFFFYFREVDRIFYVRGVLLIFLESNKFYILFFFFDSYFLIKKKVIGNVLFFLLKKL